MSGFPGVVKQDEKLGRYIEATRDIKPGQVYIDSVMLMSLSIIN
jgi:hypothetical protein